MWQETVVVYFKRLFHHLVGETEQQKEKHGESICPGRDLHPEQLDYEGDIHLDLLHIHIHVSSVHTPSPISTL
jgi:hypothetical protein